LCGQGKLGWFNFNLGVNSEMIARGVLPESLNGFPQYNKTLPVSQDGES